VREGEIGALSQDLAGARLQRFGIGNNQLKSCPGLKILRRVKGLYELACSGLRTTKSTAITVRAGMEMSFINIPPSWLPLSSS